jgi:hypothetical protein
MQFFIFFDQVFRVLLHIPRFQKTSDQISSITQIGTTRQEKLKL